MNVDELIERCEEFQSRYIQVSGAMFNLLAENESPSAAENVLEMSSLIREELKFWNELKSELVNA